LWASDNGVSGLLRAFVAMNSKCLASYLDGGQDENEFIFHPTRPNVSFVTPRSLVGADEVIKNRSKLGSYVTQAALAGLCGAAFAEKLEAFLLMEKELVSVKDIIASPDTVQMPEKAAVLFQIMFNAVDSIDTQDDLSNFMTFVKRIRSEEIQECFYTMAYQTKRTARLAKNNNDLREWGMKNIELLM